MKKGLDREQTCAEEHTTTKFLEYGQTEPLK